MLQEGTNALTISDIPGWHDLLQDFKEGFLWALLCGSLQQTQGVHPLRDRNQVRQFPRGAFLSMQETPQM